MEFSMPHAHAPLSWYFDPALESAARAAWFSTRYVGSRALVPERGSYACIPHDGHASLLVRGDGGPHLLRNRCAHKRAAIIDPVHRKNPDRGQLRGEQRFVCPIHAWSYGLDGRLARAAMFDAPPAGCDLPRTAVREVLGMYFEGPRDVGAELASLSRSGLWDPNLVDVSGYRFAGWDTTHYDFNWLVFMDVYFDLYHVAPYHSRTFSQIVDTKALVWDTGADWSMQVCPWRPTATRATEKYGRLRALTEELYGAQPPPHGALWGAWYPNVMIEWYPLALVLSTMEPLGPMRSRNVVEYYVPERFAHRADEILEVQRAAYDETAAEDAEICASLHTGHLADFREHLDGRGPNHAHLEHGIAHYHAWLRAHGTPELLAATGR